MIYSISQIAERLAPIFGANNVKKAIIFGSYAKGLANEHSDVDLYVDSELRGFQFIGLTEDIRTAIDKEIDVFDKRHIDEDSRIIHEIQNTGVIIYEK